MPDQAFAILLIEQRLALAHERADRAAVVGHGEIVFDGSPAQLAARADIVRDRLGVG